MDSDSDDDEFCVCLDGDGSVLGSADVCPDTSFRVYNGLLSMRRDALAALCRDCLLVSWPLAQGSFWMAHDATPRNGLEALALQLFRFHTVGGPRRPAAGEPVVSGAEWWANVSRSETIARADGYGDIGFHFDKDEDAYRSHGLIVHPAASTVTYLSSAGAPTVVLPDATISAVGQFKTGHQSVAHFVPPAVGRHVRFDGRSAIEIRPPPCASAAHACSGPRVAVGLTRRPPQYSLFCRVPPCRP